MHIIWDEVKVTRLKQEPEYAMVPGYTVDALARYINDKLEPGGFLTAVLKNDLKSAVGRADLQNRAALADIVKMVFNHAPAVCWGSPEDVNNWLFDN